MSTRRAPSGVETSWSWQWRGWASWPVSPLALAAAALAVAIDVVSAWLAEPEWYLGRILMSPALPVALVLVAAIGPARVGFARASLRAWRELLVVGGVAIGAGSIAYARSIARWPEVVGVVVTAAGEEVVYRLGAVLLVGAVCARLVGRDWRDTATWGSGPVLGGLVGGALVFSALPGHVDQMQGIGTALPFASLAVLLGYAALRTGSILPGIVVHVLLDFAAIAFFADAMSAAARVLVASVLLGAITLGTLVAGRRLGLRRRVPNVIDLRDAADHRDDVTDDAFLTRPSTASVSASLPT